MTGLRTIWGISLSRIENEFGKKYLDYLNQQAAKYIEDNFYKPLKLARTSFNPLEKFSPREIVPTENDTIFRKRSEGEW